MGKQPDWQAEKQPSWLVAAIKKTISSLPGGYAEAAEWLGVTQNAIFNRLRLEGDQIFPLGWVMVLQQASGKTYIADAVSRATNGGYHVPGTEVEDANEEICGKLAELVGRLGDLVNAYREYVADEVVTQQEWQSLNEIAYQCQYRSNSDPPCQSKTDPPPMIYSRTSAFDFFWIWPLFSLSFSR